MKAVVQRVSKAEVRVEGKPVGAIGRGLLVFLGVGKEDDPDDIQRLFDKIPALRIFPNDNGKFDRSLVDIQGELLIVSQFTLFGDCRKGRRPAFDAAAPPALAETLYLQAIEYCRAKGIPTQSGQFAAMMEVDFINDGPVTLLLDTKD
jgi:D-aminoacyl-tRNA deacylase